MTDMQFYYVSDDRQRLGPFTIGQLHSQPITPSTMVWSRDLGMQQWMPAGQIPELASLFTPSVPPVQEETVPASPMAQAMQIGDNQTEQEWTETKQETSHRNNMPLIIGLAAVALAVLAGGTWAWWNASRLNNDSDRGGEVTLMETNENGNIQDDINPSEDYSSQETDFDNESIDKNEMDDFGTFAPDYTYSGSENFINMVLSIDGMLQQSGLNVFGFSDMRELGKVVGNQILYEHSDGVRYQFFFDEPVKSPSACLTGIAVSRAVSSPANDCVELDYALASRGYDEVRNHLYHRSGENGLYYSPGYKNQRIYCYIYMPNAPAKEAAPRN